MFTLDNVDWTQIPPDNNTGIQFPIQLLLRGDISHEPPGEGVARTSRIANLLHWQRGSAKGMPSDPEGAFAKENGGAVFSVLDD